MRPGGEAETGESCKHLHAFIGRCVIVASVLLLAGFGTSTRAVAQEYEDARIERIRFEGADAVDKGELRGAIVSQETQCRSIILQPICWVTDWSGVVDQYYLDVEELERDVIRLRVYYFRRGYREAAVTAAVRAHDEGVEIVFDIEEGEPTRIASLEVEQTRDVLSDRDIRRARFPGESDVLELLEIELGIAHLQEVLGRKAYLDAEVRDTIRVDEAQRLADVRIVVETGRQASLDSLRISGNEQVSDDVISSALRLRRGRPLRANDVVAAQRSLYESNLFHVAEVSVPEQPDSAKTVDINVREAPPRSIRVGGGFNTIEFFQVEGRFTHYNWLGGGRRLILRTTLGNLLAVPLNGRFIFRNVLPEVAVGYDEDPFLRPTWQASISFIQPAFRSARNVLAMDVFASRQLIPGIAIDHGYGGEISIVRQIERQMPLSLTYRYELSAVDAPDLYYCVNYGVCETPTIQALRGRNTISPFTVGVQLNRADSPLAPADGYRGNFSVEHASAVSLSHYRYNRVSGEAAYYHPLNVHRTRTLSGRARIGWVRPLGSTNEALGLDTEDDRALLHPRKRFYSGGSRSVRGYGENQLGPRLLTIDPLELTEPEQGDGCSEAEIRGGTCDPTVAPVDAFLPQPRGGTALIEGSIEYRFPLLRTFTGAVFLDGAMVGEGVSGLIDRGSWAITPGVGVRVATPVGPVRVDLGIRPSVTERLPVVTEYVDEDGARRLVQLDQRRRYNPVEAAGGGFFREVLSRIALHLSIGEAF